MQLGTIPGVGMTEPELSHAGLPTVARKTVRWTAAQIYILAILVLVNVSNYLDRGIIAILQEPIKRDLGLQDWQLGLISGPAFAILYSVAGIPVARIAERTNRITVLSVALAVWSGMTCLCGAAGNFVHLLLARLGVGAGEGACTPVSHSLVSDVFPPKQRGIALSVLTMSSPLAQLLAPLVGGYIAMEYGWRAAFLVVGVPGILLAIVLRLTLREPRNDPNNPLVSRRASGKFFEDMGLLLRNRAYVWLFIATIFMGMAVSGTNVFTASYFLRQYDLTLAQVGAVMAVGLGVAGLIGTFVGGYFADRFAGVYGRSYPATCAIAAAGAGIMFFFTFTQNNWQLAIVFLLMANILNDMKNGPNYAAVQNMAPGHMRTTATAVTMIAVVVLGGSMGPLLVGVVSDLVAPYFFPAHLGSFAAVCPGGKSVVGGAAELAAACADASAAGLRGGMMVPCVAYLVASPCFLRSALKISEPLERDSTS